MLVSPIGGLRTMNRALFVMVACVALSSVALGGCAEDVDDPQAPAPGQTVQSDPPQQQLNARLRDPEAALLSGIEINRGFESVPIKQGGNPPAPDPFKAANTPE